VRKRFTAISVALATLPMAVITATASPAIAESGSNCGAYPAGQTTFLFQRSFVAESATIRDGKPAENSAKVNKGQQIKLIARLQRGGDKCFPKGVAFYLKGRGASTYHFTGSAVTNFNGDAILTKTVNNGDFRWYAKFNATESGLGLVQDVSDNL